MQRTSTIELDQSFDFDGGAVSKTWTDTTTGKRYIRGVASGVKVDRDGERVSANAIRKMAAQASSGGVKLTSSHQQDWATEIGDVVKAEHDPDTDELVVDCELPPEGQDPIADKAWNTMGRHGVKLGFSIGGKLRKAFYEVGEGIGKRKVLDEIALRHVALTANPSYGDSFAHAVAKTFEGTLEEIEALPVFEVDDDETLASEQIEKGLAPSTQGQGGDSKTGDRFAGEKKKKGSPFETEDPDPDRGSDDERPSEEEDPQATPPEDEQPGEQDPEDDLDDSATDPMDEAETAPEPESRHIACPNCGHEFAVPLPSEGDMSLTEPDKNIEAEAEDDEEDPDAEPEEDPEATDGEKPEATPENSPDEEEQKPPRPKNTAKPFGKTAEEKKMPLNDTLEMLSGLVEKDTAAAEDAETVEKDTTEEPSDVLKMVAASHETLAGRLDGIEESLGEAFGLVAKAISDQQAVLAELPVGRKSVARVLPTRDEVESPVEKTAEEIVADAPDAVTALKALNQAHYGIQ